MSDLDPSISLESATDDWLDDSETAEAIEVVDDLEFDAVDELFVETETVEAIGVAPRALSAVSTDPFARFVDVVAEAARAAGASAEVLSAIPALFGLQRVGRDEGRPLRPAQVTREVHAWMSVLRGEAMDLGACGSLPLDEWAAGIVARAVGDTTLVPAVRRELRGRGVLAFGLLAA
jgi:hypothetical protein